MLPAPNLSGVTVPLLEAVNHKVCCAGTLPRQKRSMIPRTLQCSMCRNARRPICWTKLVATGGPRGATSAAHRVRIPTSAWSWPTTPQFGSRSEQVSTVRGPSCLHSTTHERDRDHRVRSRAPQSSRRPHSTPLRGVVPLDGALPVASSYRAGNPETGPWRAAAHVLSHVRSHHVPLLGVSVLPEGVPLCLPTGHQDPHLSVSLQASVLVNATSGFSVHLFSATSWRSSMMMSSFHLAPPLFCLTLTLHLLVADSFPA